MNNATTQALGEITEFCHKREFHFSTHGYTVVSYTQDITLYNQEDWETVYKQYGQGDDEKESLYIHLDEATNEIYFMYRGLNIRYPIKNEPEVVLLHEDIYDRLFI